MPFDAKRVDLVVQYALLLAGEEDEAFERQLGPIHLIKYVYLADVAWAESHQGKSFTGASWQFHHFGPWDASVYERIEPAAKIVHAEALRFESKYGDEDWVRYRVRDTRTLNEMERIVPSAITARLPRLVHTFLADTPSLLDYVYKTKPMLCAAPQEYLDLSLAAAIAEDDEQRAVIIDPDGTTKTVAPDALPMAGRSQSDVGEVRRRRSSPEESLSPLRMEQLSNKKKRLFHERVRALHEKQPSRQKLVNPVSAPRYDKVFEEGVAWLDHLAGSPLKPGELIVEFSDDVWDSSTRKGEDGP